MLGEEFIMCVVSQLPGDTKRVFVSQLSADKSHLGVSRAVNEFGKFLLTVSTLKLDKVAKEYGRHSALGR